MVHHLKLRAEPFARIKAKEKTVELRLYDKKRAKISVGDTIEFLCIENHHKKVRAHVIALHRFSSFEDLYKAIPAKKLGYREDELATASASDMACFYSKDDVQKFGVVGIEVKIQEDWHDSENTRTSRYISLLLRHKPEVAGLTLDQHGWADVNDLVAGVSKTHYLTKELLEELVVSDDKQRYSYNPTKTKIRANQGHSVPVDVELERRIPPKYLWHGTGEKYLPGITQNGLVAKSRLYVHLSEDKETARAVGSRHGKPVVFRVSAQEMNCDGFIFYRSVNGVWLTSNVPSFYLHRCNEDGEVE